VTDGIGNAEQVRVVAEQLFEVWKLEQAREAKDSRRWWQGNASGWLGIVVIIVGGIVTASNIHNLAADANARSVRNENAIVNMRVTNSDRLARIETKVDRILEDSGK
jgi:copper homeostasis protein CutC